MWQGALKVRISYNGLIRARYALFRQLQRLSLAYHRSHTQGDAINRLVNNTGGVQQAFNLVQGVFVNVATLVVIAIVMLGMNVRLALVALFDRPAVGVGDPRLRPGHDRPGPPRCGVRRGTDDRRAAIGGPGPPHPVLRAGGSGVQGLSRPGRERARPRGRRSTGRS